MEYLLTDAHTQVPPSHLLPGVYRYYSVLVRVLRRPLLTPVTSMKTPNLQHLEYVWPAILAGNLQGGLVKLALNAGAMVSLVSQCRAHLVLAPCLNKNSTVWVQPLSTAQWRGVIRSCSDITRHTLLKLERLTISLASTSAPCSSNNWQISVFPSWNRT